MDPTITTNTNDNNNKNNKDMEPPNDNSNLSSSSSNTTSLPTNHPLPPLMMNRIKDYQVTEEIGVGSFANVYKAVHVKTKEIVAIKAVHLKRLSNRKLWDNLQTEIQALRNIGSNPHIVELYDIIKSDRYVYLVMEYCDQGDLLTYLRQQPGSKLKESMVKRLMMQLADALKSLHACNLVHRDLKPQNLLLKQSNHHPKDQGSGGGRDNDADDNDDDEEDLTLKVADFGFARFMDPTQENQAETMCGSPLYMAPEVLSYEKYDHKADLWSVGAVMYELMYGKPPYRADNHINLWKLIEHSPPLQLPLEPAITNECANLLLRLLQRQPSRRISFKEFFHHPFLLTTTSTNNDKDYNHTTTSSPSKDVMIQSEPKPIIPSGSSLTGPSLLTISLSRRASHPLLHQQQQPHQPSIPSLPSSLKSSTSTSNMKMTTTTMSSLASSSASLSSSSIWMGNGPYGSRVMRVSWEEEMIDLLPVQCRLQAQRAMLQADIALEQPQQPPINTNNNNNHTEGGGENESMLETLYGLNKGLTGLLECFRLNVFQLNGQLGQLAWRKVQSLDRRIQRFKSQTIFYNNNTSKRIINYDKIVADYVHGLALEAGFKDLLGYANVWRVYQRIFSVVNVNSHVDDNVYDDAKIGHKYCEALTSLLQERLTNK